MIAAPRQIPKPTVKAILQDKVVKQSLYQRSFHLTSVRESTQIERLNDCAIVCKIEFAICDLDKKELDG